MLSEWGERGGGLICMLLVSRCTSLQPGEFGGESSSSAYGLGEAIESRIDEGR